jgi:hypothetical protein
MRQEGIQWLAPLRIMNYVSDIVSDEIKRTQRTIVPPTS